MIPGGEDRTDWFGPMSSDVRRAPTTPPILESLSGAHSALRWGACQLDHSASPFRSRHAHSRSDACAELCPFGGCGRGGARCFPALGGMDLGGQRRRSDCGTPPTSSTNGQAARLVFSPVLFSRRPVFLAEMIAPLITAAIHHRYGNLRRFDRSRSDLLLRQTQLLEPLDLRFTLAHTLLANLIHDTSNAPRRNRHSTQFTHRLLNHLVAAQIAPRPNHLFQYLGSHRASRRNSQPCSQREKKTGGNAGKNSSAD